MATFNVMLNETTEFGGGLYIIPGSHRLGLQESIMDTSTGYKLWVIPKEKMIEYSTFCRGNLSKCKIDFR